MKNDTMWAERVAEWKSSGLSSEEYCEGKPFTAGGLRHWAYRLRRAKTNEAAPEPTPAPVSTALAVRVARVVRVPTPTAVPERTRARSRGTRGESVFLEALSIECSGMRVTVRPGFDRKTLGALLEVLAQRGGAR